MPFLVNFKICLHADEKPYCIEEACSNTRVRADKVSSNQALLLTLFRLVDLVMCAQCLTPACSAVPLQRTWRNFVLRLQNATNQTAVIAPYATASGFSKHAKCKEPYCVHSPTSDKNLSATLWDAGRLCPKMSTSKKTKQSMNESAGRFCALFWDISVGTDQQVDKHAPSPEWCSRRGSECHQWAFDGFIFGRINMSLTSILSEKDWHWLDLLWSWVKKKKKTASPSSMQFTTPAAKLLI